MGGGEELSRPTIRADASTGESGSKAGVGETHGDGTDGASESARGALVGLSLEEAKDDGDAIFFGKAGDFVVNGLPIVGWVNDLLVGARLRDHLAGAGLVELAYGCVANGLEDDPAGNAVEPGAMDSRFLIDEDLRTRTRKMA